MLAIASLNQCVKKNEWCKTKICDTMILAHKRREERARQNTMLIASGVLNESGLPSTPTGSQAEGTLIYINDGFHYSSHFASSTQNDKSGEGVCGGTFIEDPSISLCDDVRFVRSLPLNATILLSFVPFHSINMIKQTIVPLANGADTDTKPTDRKKIRKVKQVQMASNKPLIDHYRAEYLNTHTNQ